MLLNRILSLSLLLILFPILVVVALVLVLNDGFPIFIKQKRIGQNNALFWVYKFRTMKKETPDIPTHLLDDPSALFTKSGPFLRKFSLDELPQLINILKGDMTFIGPRPALYNQEDLIDLRTQCGVHTLIPGVTGWAQVNGRDELSIHDKVKMEEYYLKNQSLWFNIKILFMTGVQVLFPKGVSH